MFSVLLLVDFQNAKSIADALIAEMEASNISERAGRLIDGEGGSESMEGKKKEGYF